MKNKKSRNFKEIESSNKKWKKPVTEAVTQKCYKATLLKSHFGMGVLL